MTHKRGQRLGVHVVGKTQDHRHVFVDKSVDGCLVLRSDAVEAVASHKVSHEVLGVVAHFYLKLIVEIRIRSAPLNVVKAGQSRCLLDKLILPVFPQYTKALVVYLVIEQQRDSVDHDVFVCAQLKIGPFFCKQSQLGNNALLEGCNLACAKMVLNGRVLIETVGPLRNLAVEDILKHQGHFVSVFNQQVLKLRNPL